MSNPALFAAELGAEVPTLDLHGTYPDEVEHSIDVFITGCYADEVRVFKIIYGKGTGRLRDTVHAILKKHAMVDCIEEKPGYCFGVLYR